MGTSHHPGRDLAGRPLTLVAIWGPPVALMIAANFLQGPAGLVILMLALSLAWMGIACGINALRCRRLHCLVASPVFLAGALLIALEGLGILDLGSAGINVVVWGSLLGAALGFGAEKIWGKFLPRGR